MTPLSRILGYSLGRADWCVDTGDAWDFYESGSTGRDVASAMLPEMQKHRTEAGGPRVLANKASGMTKNGWRRPDDVIGCPKLPN